MVHNGSQRAESEYSDRLWTFAGCEFDELQLELRVHGKPVELELKPLEVLLQLLRHAGEVVTKEELLEAVWPGLMVVDGSLATAMSKLRKALADEDSSIVLTVPRVGYRLAVPVHSRPITASSLGGELGFNAGDTVPGRERWRLVRPLDASRNSEVWLAEHPKTHELRVFKFASNEARLKGLKREVTVSRFLRESLGARPQFVQILEWNFESRPYFIESEYGGPNLAAWGESQNGLSGVPLETRLRLLTDVALAVAAAHAAGVLHKDLKPANILVTSPRNDDWQVKVADFGSASLVEPSKLKALGITNLGLTQTGGPPSSSLTGTLMYLAPEVLSGRSPTAAADVYALGVMLYQLVAGDFRKPLSPGWEADIPDPLIREDIAQAACGDTARRLTSAAELGERLAALDRRRIEREQREQTREIQQIAERKRERARVRRPWVLVAGTAFLLALSVSLILYRKASSSNPRLGAVAVLPFQNAGSDHTADFLSLALPDEIATQLSYSRSLPIRPFAVTSKYTQPNLDLQKAGREMKVASIVTGHFLRAEEHLQITLEAVDVESNRLLWRDTLNVPAENMIAMQEQIAALARGGLAPALGAFAFTKNRPARPANEEAYGLYLRSDSLSTDAAPNKEAIGMLQKAVELDPNYAPAWVALSTRYYYEASYGTGGEEMMERSDAAAERALAIDHENIAASASLILQHAEKGQLAKAYQEADGLVYRRPDSGDAHFILAYVLRYAGLLQEAADQCETALSLDPHNPGWRSCSGVFLLRGDYQRSLDYVRLDQGSEWSQAHVIDALLREGNEKEALLIDPSHIAQWQSYSMLMACVQHRPSIEIATLADKVQPVDDPEMNYYFGSHLAYCGQTRSAIQMLRRAIQGSYCSYPAMDSDPFFARLRDRPEFPEIRSAGIACQNKFLAQRGQPLGTRRADH
jgi:serine/threonine protein kinase/DNA-binding winged helix-turn-helix (wHTH) protein